MLVLDKQYEEEYKLISIKEETIKLPEIPTNASFGARVIHTILRANNIRYKAEKPIKTGDTYQYIDFYLPEHTLAIEYHGSQHYEETGGFFREDLATIQKRDKRKREYCKTIGLPLLEIHYSVDTIEKAVKVLRDYIPINTTPSIVETPRILPEEDIIAYYKEHTREEVWSKFNLTRHSLDRVAKKYGYTKPQERAVISTNIETGEEVEYPTIHAAEATGAHEIADCCNGIRKKSNGCTWRYKDGANLEAHVMPKDVEGTREEIIDYYKTHSKPETIEHFKGLTTTKFNRIVASSGYNRKNYPVKSYCINTDEVVEYTSKAEAERVTGSRDLYEPLASGKGITKVGDNIYTWVKDGQEFDEEVIRLNKINVWIQRDCKEIAKYVREHTNKETSEHFSKQLGGADLTAGNMKSLFKALKVNNKKELREKDLS